MSKSRLSQAGVLLHGVRWRAALARDLGVSMRMVRRWDDGTSLVPFTVYAVLTDRLGTRLAAVLDILQVVQRSMVAEAQATPRTQVSASVPKRRCRPYGRAAAE